MQNMDKEKLGKLLETVTNNKGTLVDCTESVDEYLSKSDWRINANANVGYSHAGLVNNLAGKVVANYWLDSVYNDEEGKAHRDGDYHIHDLDNLAGYCHFFDTMLQTKEYGNIEIGKLAEMGVANTFTVYSKTPQGTTVEAKAFNARKTGKNRELIKLTFEDGHEVECTPNHRIMLSNGQYKEAKDLTKDDDIAVA